MARIELIGDGRRVLVEGDLNASFELAEGDSWLALAFSDTSIVRVLDFDGGGLKIGCMVNGTAEVERSAAASDEGSDHLTLHGDLRWLVAGSSAYWCREPHKPMAHCNSCGYSADPDHFDDTVTNYKDLRCPLCGTSVINTSDLAEAIPGYSQGSDNSASRCKRT